MGFEVLAVTMLPRPPVMESDKILHGNSLQLADRGCWKTAASSCSAARSPKQHACGTNSCCSGDVARIDELTRLIAGIDGKRSHEDILFELEDVAIDIFKPQAVRDAVVPIAEFLYSQVEAGHQVIPGSRIEKIMDDLVGVTEKPKAGGFFGRLVRRA